MRTTFICDWNLPFSKEQLTVFERVSLKLDTVDAIFKAETLVSDLDLFFRDIIWLLIWAKLVGHKKTRLVRWLEKFVCLSSLLLLFSLSAMVVNYSLKVSATNCELIDVLESDFKCIILHFLAFRLVSWFTIYHCMRELRLKILPIIFDFTFSLPDVFSNFSFVRILLYYGLLD